MLIVCICAKPAKDTRISAAASKKALMGFIVLFIRIVFEKCHVFKQWLDCRNGAYAQQQREKVCVRKHMRFRLPKCFDTRRKDEHGQNDGFCELIHVHFAVAALERCQKKIVIDGLSITHEDEKPCDRPDVCP